MNFCCQPTNFQPQCIVDDTLRCEKGLNYIPKPDQFRQDFNKLALPTSIVRSSSLSKISNSCKKVNSSLQKDETLSQNAYLQKLNTNSSDKKPFQINFQQTKTRIDTNTKSAIVNKLFQKNQITSRHVQKIKLKQNHNQKQKIALPTDRFYHKHQNVQKLVKLYKEKSQKQLKQCTFNPKINAQTSARNLDSKEFYKQQIEHCKRTQDKIEQMRLMIQAEKEKQNTFRPKLSQQTLQLTQRRAKNYVYERLYNQGKEQNCESTGNSVNQNQRQKFKRSVSKNSISLANSNKRKYQHYPQSQEKQKKINFFRNQTQNGSRELKRQGSIKTFSQMMLIKQSQNSTEVKKKQNNNNFLSKRKKTIDSKQTSKQNSQKKSSLQAFNYHQLDCRQLIKQKHQQTNFISRQQSCKLITSRSRESLSKQQSKQYNRQNHQSRDKIVQRNKTSQKNEKIALQKFTKQFFTVIKKLGLKRQIDFNQMLTLMKNMNFIQNLQEFYEAQSESELKIKTFEIWTILEGTQNNQIFLMNLFRLLCAILGYGNSQKIEQTLKSVIESFNLKEISPIKQGKTLVLSQKDSKAIKKDFMNFYLTKFKLGQSKLCARQSVGHIYSFRPSISKQSEEYAEKYREKIIAQSQRLINQGLIDFIVPENGEIDHSTLLILDQKIKNYKMEQMRLESERQKRRIQDESMAQHSLSHRSIHQTSITDRRGKTEQELNSNIFSRISHNQSQSRSKDQIFVELYQQGRKSRGNRRDRSADEVQYQEAKQELTFKPKINNQSKTVRQFNQNINLHENIPNFTKEVMRMRKNKNSIQKDQLSISPLLYLNVTMQGNQQTRIPVYQTDNLQSITQKVRIMMKIENGEEEKNKLKNLLKEQIIPILDELGMRQGQQCFLSEK